MLEEFYAEKEPWEQQDDEDEDGAIEDVRGGFELGLGRDSATYG